MTQTEEIILFHYAESIYSHRVVWYLKLAGIQYSECIQPPIMPRPDLAELGVSYRRIPVLSIGRHVYCDTQLILDVLRERYPLKGVSLATSDNGLQKLFQHWNIDQVFWHAARCLPFERSAFSRDPAFVADRAEATGGAFRMEDVVKMRPESWAQLRISFGLLETFLKDGRTWILGGEAPSVVDIDAVFLAQWLITDPVMEGSIPNKYFSKELFPRMYEWVYRFKDAIKSAEAEAPVSPSLDGGQARESITEAPETPPQVHTEVVDPLGLEIGQTVEIWPSDWASNHHTRGELVMLTIDEVCIRNSRGIFVHFPRWNYRIQAATDDRPIAGITNQQEDSARKDSCRLVYHPMSPYSRKVYMLALELGLENRIDLETVVVAPVKYPGWSDDVGKVAQSNPLAKIPTLIIGNDEDGIYDSRVICDFLESEAAVEHRPTSGAGHWRLRALHACADGMLDAQVLTIYENKIRAENNVKYQPWIDGQLEKIMRGFDRLEFEARRGTLEPPSNRASASAAEVAVAACVGFMDIVGVRWREGRSKLTEWFEVWQKRESFVRTRPDVNWKTGEVADIGFAREALAGQKG